MSREKRVTIHDVARHAGVSHTTVSWVIHNDVRISAATKLRVQDAIKELDYHPNQVARSLVSGTSNTIALLSSFYSSNFEIEILKGIERGFMETASSMSVLQFTTRDDDEKKREAFEQILYGRRADALICLNMDVPDKFVHEFVRAKTPLVLIESKHPAVHCVCGKSYQGSLLALEHLYANGYKKIAFVGSSMKSAYVNWSTAERLRAYADFHKNHNLPLCEELYFQVRHYYFQDGEAIVDDLARSGVEAAFCAAGDMVALGIISGALAKGFRIPQDLAIVGYDNSTIAPLVSPPLSSVAQDIEGMGATALRLCLDLLKNPAMEARELEFETALHVRASSGTK